MPRKHQPGCPCCEEECVVPSVTITGYTGSGSWTLREPGDGINSCCYSRTFIADSPSVTTVDCSNVCNNAFNSRWIVHRRVTLASVIRVWVTKSNQTCSPLPAGDKWFVTCSVRDSVQYIVHWNYGGLFGPVPTCMIPCPPPADTTTPTTCQWFNQGGPNDEYEWYRTKAFSTYPTGTLTFTNSDRLSCLLVSGDLYDLPCYSGVFPNPPIEQRITDKTFTTNMIPIVNTQHGSAVCSGTFDLTTTLSPPTWSITFP